eukprot:2348802-Alexandrium_andersonii.AAC.1
MSDEQERLVDDPAVPESQGLDVGLRRSLLVDGAPGAQGVVAPGAQGVVERAHIALEPVPDPLHVLAAHAGVGGVDDVPAAGAIGLGERADELGVH